MALDLKGEVTRCSGGVKHLDVVVTGGGQAGLAAGYYLRRPGLSHAILDAP